MAVVAILGLPRVRGTAVGQVWRVRGRRHVGEAGRVEVVVEGGPMADERRVGQVKVWVRAVVVAIVRC